jgi:hypothetical protein
MKLKLRDYERKRGFKKRSSQAEEDARVAVAMSQPIDLSVIARTLQVPVDVAAAWVHAHICKPFGDTKQLRIVMSDKGLPQ